MQQTIDYTKKRISKAIAICPKCGKRGEMRKYKDGSVAYNHKAKLIDSPIGHYLRIEEQCFIRA